MQYARDRALRETLYRAYGTVASEQGDPKFDNSAADRGTARRCARRNRACWATATSPSCACRRAGATAPHRSSAFLRDLARRAQALRRARPGRNCATTPRAGTGHGRPAALGRALCLRTPARGALCLLRGRDQAVLHRTARAGRAVRGDRIALRRAPARDSRVGLARGRARRARRDTPTAKLVGHLYLDLYARSGKQRRRVGRQRAHPAPGRQAGCKPPWFTSPAISPNPMAASRRCSRTTTSSPCSTRAGHALHALLSEVDEPGAAAFASVEWDAIELPSQIHGELLLGMAGGAAAARPRVDTGAAAAARALRQAAGGAQRSRAACRPYGRSSSRCSTCCCTPGRRRPISGPCWSCWPEVRGEVAVLIPPPGTGCRTVFAPHLFAGGYGAGYYSCQVGRRCYPPMPTKPSRRRRAPARGTLDAGHRGTLPARILAVGGARPQRRFLQGLPRPRTAHRRAAAPQRHDRASGLTPCAGPPCRRIISVSPCPLGSCRSTHPSCGHGEVGRVPFRWRPPSPAGRRRERRS